MVLCTDSGIMYNRELTQNRVNLRSNRQRDDYRVKDIINWCHRGIYGRRNHDGNCVAVDVLTR